ncbi:hypothetical protein FGO68_gene11940 [Halteria grandinella]|uniref:Uncharacterized protein n=1 Tax=Halteria grandinella TaxID=5974 RepID=A0A8J8N9L4_HALGN|nr:hypothetical protein FGO68_gene11940 [Halteria grandinella]
MLLAEGFVDQTPLIELLDYQNPVSQDYHARSQHSQDRKRESISHNPFLLSVQNLIIMRALQTNYISKLILPQQSLKPSQNQLKLPPPHQSIPITVSIQSSTPLYSVRQSQSAR